MARRVNKNLRSDALTRAVIVDLCKDGTVTFRDRGQSSFNGMALPVFSVDTNFQAEQLQIRFCRKMHKDHPLMPGKPWYMLSMLKDGNDPAISRPEGLVFKDIEETTEMFTDYWDEFLKDQKPEPLQHCHIVSYYHCRKCLGELVIGGGAVEESPEKYARLNIGATPWGFQIWCVRHSASVVHIDFLGQKVSTQPADLPADAKPTPLEPDQVLVVMGIAQPNVRLTESLNAAGLDMDNVAAALREAGLLLLDDDEDDDAVPGEGQPAPDRPN